MPILAGATLRERMIACLGALVGIALTGLICRFVLGNDSSLPLIVAPLGASAVLLFAVPTSPLAQPWSIIGGNTVSAFVGVFVARFVHDPVLAIGFGVSIAIAAMSFARCLHPPGGAAALTAIIGGPAVTNAGFLFPFVPVALNCVLLVALGILFHRLSSRAYPHVAKTAVAPRPTTDPSPELRAGFRPEDLEQALVVLDETYDIGTADLDRLLREAERQAALRSHGAILCSDIMSRDVITIAHDDTLDSARHLLLTYDIRTLPVVDAAARLSGTIGLREIANKSGTVGAYMSPAATCVGEISVLTLVPTLTDGKTHSVIVVDPASQIAGIVTQTDLLAAVAKLLPITA